MLLPATSNGVGVNVRLVGYGLSVSRYQGIYNNPVIFTTASHAKNWKSKARAIITQSTLPPPT